jgi:ATP-dependent Clp protease ATP-binding subunit ClpC
VGAPPGYVGYEEGGQLTERIRRRPYSVILLDEVEKAHPDVFNMLLQIMEEGRLTDSFGRNVDFKNTVLIMTSNLGSEIIKGGAGFGFGKRTEASDFENIRSVLMKEVERFFRPEFINRLDDIIIFRPLNKADITLIVDYEVAKVSKRLAQQGYTIELDAAAKELIIDRGYNPEFGARPLRRAVGQLIEDPLSEMLLSGTFEPPCIIKVTRRNDSDGKPEDHLYFDSAPAVPAAAPAANPSPETAGST